MSVWILRRKNLSDQDSDRRNGLIHSRRDFIAQTHAAVFAAEILRLAPDKKDLSGSHLDRLRHPQDIHWIHGMRLNDVACLLIKFGEIRFQHRDCSGLLTVRISIHKNRSLVSILQGIGKVQSADSKVG